MRNTLSSINLWLKKDFSSTKKDPMTRTTRIFNLEICINVSISFSFTLLSVTLAEISNKTMHLPISISCDRGRGKKTIETKALVDSGAGGTFIDQNFAWAKGFRLQKLEHPITVYNIDGTLNKWGTIVHFIETNIKIGERTWEIWFLVLGLGRQRIILGFPWLEKENPVINWKKATLDWPPEEQIWKPKYRLQLRTCKRTPRPIIEEIYNDDDQFNSPINPISSDEPNLLLPINEEPCSGIPILKSMPHSRHRPNSCKRKGNRQSLLLNWCLLNFTNSYLSLTKGFRRLPWILILGPQDQIKRGTHTQGLQEIQSHSGGTKRTELFHQQQSGKRLHSTLSITHGLSVLFIGKKVGSFRPCQDYRYLNNGTIKNAYPLPLISELIDLLHGDRAETNPAM